MHKHLNTYWNNPALWEQYGRNDYYSERVSFVKSIIPHEVNSVLDVGAGKGEIVNDLTKSIRTAIGLDISKEALNYLTGNAILGRVENLPFPDKRFDLVMCMEVIEHLPVTNFDVGINELQRVARKYLLVSVPYNENIDYRKVRCPYCKMIFNVDTHFRSFKTEKEICQLFPEFQLSAKWLSGPLYKQPSRVGLFIRQKIMNVYLPLDQYFVCIYCGASYDESGSLNRNILTLSIKRAFKILQPLFRSEVAAKILHLLSRLKKMEPCWMFVLLKRINSL